MLTCGSISGDQSPSPAFESSCESESRMAPAQIQLTASFCVGLGACESSPGAPDSSHWSAQHPSGSARQSCGQAMRKATSSKETKVLTRISSTSDGVTHQVYRPHPPRGIEGRSDGGGGTTGRLSGLPSRPENLESNRRQ
jgi:hypothetical protein